MSSARQTPSFVSAVIMSISEDRFAHQFLVDENMNARVVMQVGG